MGKNEACNDCKFQIHQNNLEWVDPKSRNEKKNLFVNIPTILI